MDWEITVLPASTPTAEPFHLIWLWTFKPHSCGRIFFRLFWNGVPECVEELHPAPRCLEGGPFGSDMGFFTS